jgi:hypothetical protein
MKIVQYKSKQVRVVYFINKLVVWGMLGVSELLHHQGITKFNAGSEARIIRRSQCFMI